MYRKIIIFLAILGTLIWGSMQWRAYSFRQDFERQINYTPNAFILYTEPYQKDIEPFLMESAGHRLQVVAEFQIEALLISKKHYTKDDFASISPLDLGLGWDKMADPARILKFKRFRQGSRYFAYHWEGQMPLAPDEMIKSFSNIHVIPENEDILDQLHNFNRGDFIRLEGYLVNVERVEDGRKWSTSTTRYDTRRGACEILFVKAVQRL